MTTMSIPLRLAHGFAFEDLYEREGLVRVDATFLDHVRAADAALYARLIEARAHPEQISRQQHSALIVELAPHVEDFVGELFGIASEVRSLQARHHALAPLFALSESSSRSGPSAALLASRPRPLTAR